VHGPPTIFSCRLALVVIGHSVIGSLRLAPTCEGMQTAECAGVPRTRAVARASSSWPSVTLRVGGAGYQIKLAASWQRVA